MKKLTPCSETWKLGTISVLLVITSNTTEAVEARIDIHSFLYKNCDAGDWFEFESKLLVNCDIIRIYLFLAIYWLILVQSSAC